MPGFRHCYILFLFFSSFSLAQSGSQTDLDVNNVRARFNSNGQLFWDGNSVAKFEVPKITDANSIRKNVFFLSTLWFYAIDSTGDTLMAVQQYGQNGTEFGLGALPPGAGIGFSLIEPTAGIWKITPHDLQQGMNDSDKVIESVRYWPDSYEYNGTTYTLEPYIDNNKNGLYDPTLGDIPYLESLIPNFGSDQQVSFVYHDMVNHPITQTKPIGLQIFVDGFALSSNHNSLNETIFIRYKVISQNQDLKSFRMGLYADFDLGNYSDDMVGTDTSRNMIYAYNGDDDDEGILGYGLNPPAVGAVFVDQPLCLSCFHGNVPEWKDSTSAFRYPKEPGHFRNIMEGLSTNGDTLVATGPGIKTGTRSPHAFTGNPITHTGWTMGTDTFDAADFKMIGITGKDSLLRGDTFELLVAYVYARTNSGGARGGLGELQKRVDWLWQNFLGDKPDIQKDCFKRSQPPTEDSTGTAVLGPEEKILSIFPNPNTGSFQIRIDENASYLIMNALGQVVGNGRLENGDNPLTLSDLSDGVYMLQARSSSGMPYRTVKLIVQH